MQIMRDGGTMALPIEWVPEGQKDAAWLPLGSLTIQKDKRVLMKVWKEVDYKQGDTARSQLYLLPEGKEPELMESAGMIFIIFTILYQSY